MIDTIRLKSPPIDLETAHKIERECIKRQGIDLKTGEVIYEITTGSLEGSYDHRIKIDVRYEQFEYIESEDKTKLVQTPAPYIIIETSLHKMLLGHNVKGGSNDLISQVRFMLQTVTDIIETDLPCYSLWEVERIDYSECYRLQSDKHCYEYFRGLNSAIYPRRRVIRYDLTGTYAPGTTTALKLYHKGTEFKKHDMPRLKQFITTPEEFNQLYQLLDDAMHIIRVEVEIKKRKLKYDFHKIPLVTDLTIDYLQTIYDNEIRKLLREGENTMKIVRDMITVKERLYMIYKPNKASILMGVWSMMATLGEDYVKEMLPDRTYYRHMRSFKDAGVSFLGTDLKIEDNDFIIDFRPIRGNKCQLSEEDATLEYKLSQFRESA